MKRSRLAELQGLGWVTNAALEKILRRIGDQAEPLTACSRSAVRRAAHDFVSAKTAYGAPLQKTELRMEDGSIFQWCYYNPHATLAFLASASEPFMTALRAVAKVHPPSEARPWRLILYLDEASPGNLLRVDNTRKVQTIYWSFAEMGHELLCREHCWILGGVLRSAVASKVSGKMSAVVKRLLHSFFGDVFNFMTTGVVIPGSPPLLIFAKFAVLVADEPAIKSVWNCKGSAGIKPCVLCKNICSVRSEAVLHDGSGYLKDIASTSVHDWDPHDDASVFECMDMLAREKPVLSAKDFDELEKALGFNYHPENLSCDLALPASTLMYDMMHVFMVGGLVNNEFHLMFRLLKKNFGIGYKYLREFVQQWKWPKRWNENPGEIFNDRREARAMYSVVSICQCHSDARRNASIPVA